MIKWVTIFVFLLTLASCRLIDDKPSPCFACSVAGKDSCQMTDNYTLFAADHPDSTATIRFARCGSGLLSTVRFNYSGHTIGDSACITIFVDSSATHTFPLSLPGGAKPLQQYQKGGFYELPLDGGIAFNQSCIVSFILRTPLDHSNARSTGRTSTGHSNAADSLRFQNIFLHWAPKASNPAPGERKSTRE